jgi:hypothetical protein
VSLRPHSAGLLDLAQTSFVLVVFAILVLDASHFGVGWAERLAYLVVVLSASFVFFIVLRTAPPLRSTWVWIAGWFLLLALWLLPCMSQSHAYHQYVAGDFVTLALPALMFPLIMASPGLLSKRRAALLGVGLTLAAILAPVLGADSNRYEPPSTMLIAGLWWLLIVTQEPKRRFFIVSLIAVLGGLIVGSGQRTALLIWLACAGYAFWQFLWSSRLGIRLLLTVVGLSLLFVVTSMRGELLAVVAGHRIENVARGESDDSLIARWEEAIDVVETLKREGSPLTYVVGFGHGATYAPQTSFVSRNITPDGRVHNIHIGPLMILFRYGLIGLALYTWLILAVVRTLSRRVRDQDTIHQVRCGFALVCLGFLMEGLMFNVLVDPLFAISLAGFFASHAPERRGQPSGSSLDRRRDQRFSLPL